MILGGKLVLLAWLLESTLIYKISGSFQTTMLNEL